MIDKECYIFSMDKLKWKSIANWDKGESILTIKGEGIIPSKLNVKKGVKGAHYCSKYLNVIATEDEIINNQYVFKDLVNNEIAIVDRIAIPLYNNNEEIIEDDNYYISTSPDMMSNVLTRLWNDASKNFTVEGPYAIEGCPNIYLYRYYIVNDNDDDGITIEGVEMAQGYQFEYNNNNNNKEKEEIVVMRAGCFFTIKI